MSWIVYIGCLVGAFFTMEGIAWVAHKYIMHGFLWSLHEDHHQPTHGFFERNDFFFLIFAIPAWLTIQLGVQYEVYESVWVDAGICLYGISYFIVHDVLIHRRFKWLDNTNNPYFKALRKAHKMHHKHLGKENGECFGMLIIPRKYIKEALQK